MNTSLRHAFSRTTHRVIIGNNYIKLCCVIKIIIYFCVFESKALIRTFRSSFAHDHHLKRIAYGSIRNQAEEEFGGQAYVFVQHLREHVHGVGGKPRQAHERCRRVSWKRSLDNYVT